MAARRKVETLKVPLFVEMIEDHFDEGKAVAVFCNFRETIEAINFRLSKQKKFRGKISFVVGCQKDQERQQNIEDFQNDVTQIILCNLEAGGVGISLHDVYGHRPRVSIISPTWKANSIVQALGRVWRANGKSKCLQYIAYASECIEEEICVKVQAKISNLNCLNDGDLCENIRWIAYSPEAC
jgi:superfamily II DNA or RNA helicase